MPPTLHLTDEKTESLNDLPKATQKWWRLDSNPGCLAIEQDLTWTGRIWRGRDRSWESSWQVERPVSSSKAQKDGWTAVWRRTQHTSHPVKAKRKERWLGAWAASSHELPLHDTHLVTRFHRPEWPRAWVGVSNIANHEGAGGSLGGLLPSLSQPPVPWQTPAGLSELEVLGVRLTLMVNRDIPNLEELEQCGHHGMRARR